MPALVYSLSDSIVPGPIRGTAYDNLMHIADILPTILGGLLGDKVAVESTAFDGVDHWTALLSSSAHPGSMSLPASLPALRLSVSLSPCLPASLSALCLSVSLSFYLSASLPLRL